MTLPASIRVNVKAPFPTLVYGTGPIVVTKANGIWTVGFSIKTLAVQVPPVANFSSQYLIGWNALTSQFFKTPFSTFGQVIAGIGRLQRSITSSGGLPVQAVDNILNINAVTDLAPVVPLASSRSGSPLTFKNLPGSHVQTLTPTGADTFDGAATIPLAAGAAVTLVPYNDGVNSGYAIE